MLNMVKRTFIALSFDIPEQLIRSIETIKADLKGIQVKWVETYNLHLTLAFLGDTNEQQVEQIRSGLRNILLPFRKLSLRLYKTGAFKTLYNPQVLWIGIDDNELLKELYNSIQQLAENAGFTTETRPFKPHLTIGRIKSSGRDNNLKEVFNSEAAIIDVDVMTDSVIFYESILTSAGPTYKSLETCSLK
jgi:2'-5' RNA ligase